MRYFNTYPNRTMCAVLDEIRNMHKTRNFSGLLGAVEELQSMGNRMEAALEDGRDAKDMLERIKQLKTQIRKLEKKRDALEEK